MSAEAETEEAPADQPGSASVTARSAGRGGIAIAAAKLFFMVAGLVQQIVLNRVLGLQDYGALGRVQAVASVVYNPIVSTSVQGVSRAVAQSPDAEHAAAARRALRVHAVASVPIAGVFLALAGVLADALRAPHLATPLRIVSAVVLLYGLYTPLVGVLNGQRRFGAQAALDALFATLRTVGLIGGAWYFAARGAGVEGAFLGFAAAAALILLVALAQTGIGKAGPGGVGLREYLTFLAPLLGGQLALNLLLQSDITLLGRFAADSAAAGGLDVRDADTLVGAYRAAQLFCFLPYQLLLSVTFVLFPLLASARRDDDGQAIARLVQGGVRLAVVLAGLMVSVTAGLPGPLLALVFGADSARLGGPAMFVLALGLGVFAIFGILTTVLTSLQRERASALLTVVALTLVVALCFAVVRGQPFGPHMLVRTALSTGAGLLLATVAAALAVRQSAGAVVSPLTLLRVFTALAAAIGFARVLPEAGKLATIGYSAAVGAVYVGVLVVSRELGRADLAKVRAVVGRR